jgi:hypothetical protein
MTHNNHLPTIQPPLSPLKIAPFTVPNYPVQRYGAAHEAQSGWTTGKQTTKTRGGEGQQFLEQNFEKRGKSAIFLVVP